MRKRALGLAALALTTLTAMTPLDTLRWSHRPVLIFSGGDDARLSMQLARFEPVRDALLERDMALSIVSGNVATTVLGPTLADSGETLRSRYRVGPNDFAVILIGKDGGEKLRARDLIEPAEIFALIDTMPMRRREMREGQ